jgi:hypothetical protein
MIPYDDLVIALATWRARQGLPVVQLSGALTPPPEVPAYATPPAPPPRAAPPAPPRGSPSSQFSHIETPPPLAAPEAGDDPLDVDDAALLEETHYENEGADFGIAFGEAQLDGESTAIGVPPPPRDSFGEPEPAPAGPPKRKKKNNDW